MDLVKLGRPTMNVLSDQEVVRQASEFAADGLAGQIIDARNSEELQFSESQALAVEKALRLALNNEAENARSTLIEEGFSHEFVIEFLDLIRLQLKNAA